MTHLDDQDLLLYAYEEVPEADVRGIEEHLATCRDCQARLETVERVRVATHVALTHLPSRRRSVPAVATALAAAATLALLVVGGRVLDSEPSTGNQVIHPGYVTGGPDLVAVDSLLNRLEQELSYANR